ncbi:MAG: hypothetical protein ACOZNI_09730 [Myxococcota bacterium]
MMLLAVALFAQDEVAEKSDVDASPYLEALADRFRACLAEEGTVSTAEDAAAIDEALAVVGPAIRYGGTSCTASADVVATCAAEIRASSCDDVHAAIAAVLDGRLGGPNPTWATAYSGALRERVGTCFAGEVGRAPTEAEEADLATFQNVAGLTLSMLAQACPVDEAKATTCTAAISATSCADVAAYIATAGEQTELMVRSFVSGCEGFLDCGGD